ncbi:MAG: 16S rRNA (cytosine(967)-C(5))-methyltransferase RsmB [Nitrospirota bacterium]|nr:16S rRNA (cytosine(967)-C(5))-methyltransferase RsmB [Nitrospirota bacterium]
MKPLPGARAAALEALLTVERAHAYADEALDRSFARASLDVRDRALAVELVYGVLRHRLTLDWRLDHVADRPVRRLPLSVQAVLRMAAYQLLYLDRIPPSAAVNEAVVLVKASPGAGARWSGFTNAVLRSLIRQPAPAWPDHEREPATRLSLQYACPAWLVDRWLARFGAVQAERLCRATLEIPPLTIRVNRLRTTREALAEDLQRSGYQVTRTAVSPFGLVLEKCGTVADIPQFSEGLFYVEDEAAQLVATLLDPQPGERILDACAAPGGKSTGLAALMENRGDVVAMDQSRDRLRRLEENCVRLGVRIVTPLVGDAAQAEPANRTGQPLSSAPSAVLFDRILLDAPCSGLGVLRRHPEGKWQKQAERLPSHHKRQLRLLIAVSRLLRPGGCLVYSTCSTEPEETTDVVDQFLSKHAEFRRESVSAVLPESGRGLLTPLGDFSTAGNGFSMDGFFASRLRKAGA